MWIDYLRVGSLTGANWLHKKQSSSLFVWIIYVDPTRVSNELSLVHHLWSCLTLQLFCKQGQLRLSLIVMHVTSTRHANRCYGALISPYLTRTRVCFCLRRRRSILQRHRTDDWFPAVSLVVDPLALRHSCSDWSKSSYNLPSLRFTLYYCKCLKCVFTCSLSLLSPSLTTRPCRTPTTCTHGGRSLLAGCLLSAPWFHFLSSRSSWFFARTNLSWM